jgi:peptidoglycan/LPS O-acetylase OafA/YrhL
MGCALLQLGRCCSPTPFSSPRARNSANRSISYWGNILGLYGVFTFFIISGFLLMRVLANASGMVEFSLNRFLRILPGFLFCISATSLVLGAIVTPLDLRAYYSQSETAGYIVNSVMCRCRK